MLQKALKNICSERRFICTREDLHIQILEVSLSAITMREKKKENCRTCPYCGETVEERMDFINQMAERLMVYSAQCRCCNNAFDSEFLRKEVC